MVRRRHDVARAPKGLRWLGRPKSRGQALVEFAVILPIAMLLLLIAIDLGRLFASYVQITNAAREGASYAAGNPTDNSGIAAHAGYEANSQGQQGEGALVVAAACANSAGHALACGSAEGGGGTGNTITVTASERFTFLTPIIGDLFGGHVTLGHSATAAVLSLAPSGGSAPDDCTTAPTAFFTLTVSGNAVSLDASGSSPTTGTCAISGYNWDMGDPNNADPWPPIVNRYATYSYASSGTYTVRLTVTNPAGDATITESVTLGSNPSPTPTTAPTPSPTATPSPTTPPPVCNTAPSFTASFTGHGNNEKKHQMTFYGAYTGQPAPWSWSWDFGNGSGSDQNTFHNYNTAGTYTVTLTVRNQNDSCVRSTFRTVIVP
jgi:PKD repeat protein